MQTFRQLESKEMKQMCRRLWIFWRYQKLHDVILMVTSGERCFRLTKDDVTEITELRSMQDQADTRMMIHVKHAAASYRNVVVISEDDDVFVILLSLHSQIPTRILLRKGKKNAVISRLGTILGQDVCQKHAGVHAFTGCDSVSAFGGQGKIKALNLINKSHEYRQLFIAFGQEWHVNEHGFQIVQAFTYEMYCAHTNTKLVNELRYEMFCAKNGDISSGKLSGKLPPCSDAT